MKCSICSSNMQKKILDWSFFCSECNYWASSLEQDINRPNDVVISKGGDVLYFLNDVRLENYKRILSALITLGYAGSLELLDVGCATGTFLSFMKRNRYVVFGIEPNVAMYNYAKSLGLEVSNGFFPPALEESRKFDIISFNDVFEHIPDLNYILECVNHHLSQDGILILNVPDSDGIFFRAAKLLSIIGMNRLWDRLWQKMFYSPHLHYFNKKSLVALLEKRGFIELVKIPMKTLSCNGLWARLNASDQGGYVLKIIKWSFIMLCIPFLRFFPSDALCIIFKKSH